MERWSVQQRIFCVEQFVLSKSIVSVQQEFCRKFGDDRQRGAALSNKIIGQWVRQWRETGSVQVKAHTCRKYPACENSLGEESKLISAVAFPTLEFVGQKCATNFTP
jgi:hypothetical protein